VRMSHVSLDNQKWKSRPPIQDDMADHFPLITLLSRLQRLNSVRDGLLSGGRRRQPYHAIKRTSSLRSDSAALAPLGAGPGAQTQEAGCTARKNQRPFAPASGRGTWEGGQLHTHLRGQRESVRAAHRRGRQRY
jgi:hypothetical protein